MQKKIVFLKWCCLVEMNSSLQIQKLLACSEEFEEFQELDILIESPFVCETVEGEGVKQVFLGKLTVHFIKHIKEHVTIKCLGNGRFMFLC